MKRIQEFQTWKRAAALHHKPANGTFCCIKNHQSINKENEEQKEPLVSLPCLTFEIYV
jgi:hypothetical protein